MQATLCSLAGTRAVLATHSQGQGFPTVSACDQRIQDQPAGTANLNLTARVDSGNCETDICQVFKGLGILGEEFETLLMIKLNSTPYALFTSYTYRCYWEVEQELARMGLMRVISSVETPTPWCAGEVTVYMPKKSGEIHIWAVNNH